jgi:hypothetical protein
MIMADQDTRDNGNTPESENSITGDVQVKTNGKTLARTVTVSGDAADLLRQAAAGPTTVKLDRSPTHQTKDQPLWVAIRNGAQAIGFNKYHKFINRILCEPSEDESKPAQSSYPTPLGVPHPEPSGRRHSRN